MKVGERTRRAREMRAGTGREYNVIGGGPLPSWKKFLSVSSDKESFTDFLCECGTIFSGGLKDGTKVISSTSSGVQEVTNLQ